MTDAAEILPLATEAQLSGMLEQFERTSGHKAVVVTVPTLDGRNIASITADLGDAFGIGGKDADGIILLVAPNEHRVRIGVADGLERTRTDDMCAEIIQRRIPPLRQWRLSAGIEAGVEALGSHLRSRRATTG